jgi:hypothetical protein
MNIFKFISEGIYNIFKGIGTFTLFPQNHIETKSDYESLMSDWDKINKDFESVLGKHKKE